jgi:hypothetical protein
LVTLSPPIRLPAKTISRLKPDIGVLLSAGPAGADQSAVVWGNRVRMGRVDHVSSRAPKLVGFVHNPDVDPKRLLDLAERWVRAPDP